jgi:hypothetical protein
MQYVADLPNRGVDAVIRVEKDVLAPDSLDHIFAGDKLSGSLGQQEKQVKRNALNPHGASLAAALVGTPIQLEIRKSVNICGHLRPPS